MKFDDPGEPYGEVEPKRSFDEKTPVSIDWHDYIANRRYPGAAVALNYVIRPLRGDATGVEYRCTQAGVTKRCAWGRIQWPLMGTVTDGTAIWTAQAVSDASLRASIASSDWPDVDGLTLDDGGNDDLIYTVLASGGISGQRYEIAHHLTLSTGEKKEGVAVLPVQD